MPSPFVARTKPITWFNLSYLLNRLSSLDRINFLSNKSNLDYKFYLINILDLSWIFSFEPISINLNVLIIRFDPFAIPGLYDLCSTRGRSFVIESKRIHDASNYESPKSPLSWPEDKTLLSSLSWTSLITLVSQLPIKRESNDQQLFPAFYQLICFNP